MAAHHRAPVNDGRFGRRDGDGVDDGGDDFS